jgi:phage regulator Rha-like protein
LPHAFNEHGVAMLSSVLNSERAIQMNILIIRAFIKMRDMLATERKLAARIKRLEAGQHQHSSVIGILAAEIVEIKQLPPPKPKRRIGFELSAASGR